MVGSAARRTTPAASLNPAQVRLRTLNANAAFLVLRTVASCRSDSRITLSIRAAVAPAIKPLAGRLDWRSTPDFKTGDFACISCSLAAIFSPRLSAAGAAGALGAGPSLADEGPPETTTLRLDSRAPICEAPQYIAEELLRAEGLTDIRYVQPSQGHDAVARGELDFDFNSGPWLASHLAAGEPVTALAGVHSGCFELIAQESIRTISDLKDKRVGISDLSSGRYLFLRIMAAYVGLDPDADINWVTSPTVKPAELFEAGKVDAFLGYPPEPQELRARKVGRVILNTATDKPWSQYFCCFVFGNKEFVRAHPIATKRFLRAILKAADMCAAEPGAGRASIWSMAGGRSATTTPSRR